jgi:molecular chaperone HtpG
LLLTSGLDEHATFTSHFHRLIKLGLAIDNDNGNEDLEDLPALDGDNDNKVSAIEQVD